MLPVRMEEPAHGQLHSLHRLPCCISTDGLGGYLHPRDVDGPARLSAPLVVSPGLEDLESLTPGESAPSLLGWVDVQAIVKAFIQRK